MQCSSWYFRLVKMTLYCTFFIPVSDYVNSEASWTPQRMPSSNALRSCSVQSLTIIRNIALFVFRGSASKYTPNCANSDLVSGGSLSLDSQYAVYRNSKIAVASVMPKSMGCSASWRVRISLSWLIHTPAPSSQSPPLRNGYCS